MTNCGYVAKPTIEQEIEFYEKRLIPMIEEYGETEMNLKLDEIKQELKRLKNDRTKNRFS